jgi:hypothetical protein
MSAVGQHQPWPNPARNGHAALQGASVRQRLRLLIEVVVEKSAMKP